MANLLLVGTAAPPAAGSADEMFAALLTARGHTVTWVAAAAGALPNTGYDACVITESGSSGSAANLSIGACALPVFLSETTVNHMKFTTAAATSVGTSTSFDFTTAGNAHPATSTLADPLQVTNSATATYAPALSAVAVEATVLAVSVGFTSNATVLAYYGGEQGADGAVVPNKRAWTSAFISATATSIAQGGKDLFVNLVEWLAGVTQTPPTPPTELAPALGGMPGVEPEAAAHITGPWTDGNGNLYRVVEDYLTPSDGSTGNTPRMMKSADGGVTWAEVDRGKRPGATVAGAYNDLEAAYLVRDPAAKVLWLTWYKGDSRWFGVKFRTSDHPSAPDTWDTGAGGAAGGSLQSTAGVEGTGWATGFRPDEVAISTVVLSTGKVRTILRGWPAGTGPQLLLHRTNTAGGAAWNLLADVTDGTDDLTKPSMVRDASDVTHLFYRDRTTGHVRYRTIAADDTVSAAVTVSSTAVAAGDAQYDNNVLTPVYYDAGGTPVVTVGWVNASKQLRTVEIRGGVVGAEQVVSTDTLTFHPTNNTGGSTGTQGPSAALAAMGTTVYAVWGDNTSGDLYYSSKVDGGTWAARALLTDTGTGGAVHWTSALAVDRAGVRTLTFTLDIGPHADDGGNIKYAALTLGVGDPGAGDWLMEDGSGSWLMEDLSGSWRIDSAEADVTTTSVTSTRATTWNTRAAVTPATRSTTWDTETSATTTRATTWAVRSSVAPSTRAASWNVAAGVAASARATTWAVRSSLTSSQATTWAVRGAITATRATTWDVRSSTTAARVTSWDVRGSATATRSTTWNVAAIAALSSVTSTRTSSWNVAQGTTGTRGTTWNVAQGASSVRATTWAVRAAVAAFRATSWDVETSSTSTRGTTWSVRSSATSTRAASWDVETSATSTRGTTWAVRGAVATTRGTTWAVASAVAGTRATTWTVAAGVATTRATSWAVAAAVTTTRATSWNVAGTLSTVTATRTTTWNVIGPVTGTRSTTWHVRGTVAATRATTWQARAAATAVRATTWDVETSTTAARAASWAVLAAQTSTRTTTWDTETRATSTRSTTWAVAVRATSTRAATWDTDTSTTSTRAIGWNVAGTLTTVTSSRSTTWNVAAAPPTSVTSTRLTSWTVRAATSASRGTTWTVRATVAGARGVSWNVAAQVTATRDGSWTVRASATSSRGTTWDVLARITATRGTTWAVVAWVTVTATRSSTWNTRAKATGTRSTTWAVVSLVPAAGQPVLHIIESTLSVTGARGELTVTGARGDLATTNATGVLE